MSLTPEQVGDLSALIPELLEIEESIRNPVEKHAVFMIATMIGALVESPGPAAAAYATLAKKWGVQPRDKARGKTNGFLPLEIREELRQK